MHVKEYDSLVVASSTIMIFVSSHLYALIKDEAYGTEEASEAIESLFKNTDIPDLKLSDILALRLCRQATNEVFDLIEALVSEETL